MVPLRDVSLPLISTPSQKFDNPHSLAAGQPLGLCNFDQMRPLIGEPSDKFIENQSEKTVIEFIVSANPTAATIHH